MAEPLLERNLTCITVSGYYKRPWPRPSRCKISRPIDIDNTVELREIVTAAITKSSRWGDQDGGYKGHHCRQEGGEPGDYTEVDIKRYVRIERSPEVSL
jgi:hypothetical protein